MTYAACNYVFYSSHKLRCYAYGITYIRIKHHALDVLQGPTFPEECNVYEFQQNHKQKNSNI